MKGVMLVFVLNALFPSKSGSIVTTIAVLIAWVLGFESEIITTLWLVDWAGWVMICLISIMVMVSHVWVKSSFEQSLVIASLLICVCFFLSNTSLWLFIWFELSVIPLFFLITEKSASSERMSATWYLLCFTFFSSVPLLVYSIWSSNQGMVFMWDSTDFSSNIWCWLSIITFLIKAPLFFTHLWLPIVHVEAPILGSIVLAGVMLKMSLIGIIRLLSSFEWDSKMVLFSNMVMSVSLVGSLVSLLSALSSDDMKKCVAYSSICHMNFAISSFMTLDLTALEVSVMAMFSHGICSPLLFCMVMCAYMLTHTRSLLLNKGVFSQYPFFQLLGFLLWMMNASVPPFFAFIPEFMMVKQLINYGGVIALVMSFGYFLFNSVFSAVVYFILSHSAMKQFVKVSMLTLVSQYLVMVWVLILSLVMLFIPLLN